MSSFISFITIIWYSFHSAQHLLHVGYFAATTPSSSLSGIEFLHLVQIRLIGIENNELLLSFFECKTIIIIKELCGHEEKMPKM